MIHASVIAKVLTAERVIYSHIDADHLCELFRMERDHSFTKLDVLQKRGIGYFWSTLDLANQRKFEILIAYCTQYEWKDAFQYTMEEITGG